MEIVLGSGVRLIVGADVDTAALSRVLRVLEGRWDDDADSDGRSCVACDRLHRRAVRLSEFGSPRTGSTQAKSARRESFLLQGETRRSFEGHLA